MVGGAEGGRTAIATRTLVFFSNAFYTSGPAICAEAVVPVA